MKIRISFTVDIDPEVWTSNYGIEGSKEIREDVREYAWQAVWAQLEAVGVLQDESL